MPNKSLALQWLIKAYHDLSSAQILYDAEHFTDTIGSALQQALEKMLKSFLAYENKKIKKTHDLIELSELIKKYITFEESDVLILAIATNYYAEDRYPAHHLTLPSRQEIKEVLDFANSLFSKCCGILDIDQKQFL